MRVSLSLLQTTCLLKGSGDIQTAMWGFAPRVACALQEALPASRAGDQPITNTIGALWVQTNDSHKALTEVTSLDSAMVCVNSTSFFSPQMQLLATYFLSGYKL